MATSDVLNVVLSDAEMEERAAEIGGFNAVRILAHRAAAGARLAGAAEAWRVWLPLSPGPHCPGCGTVTMPHLEVCPIGGLLDALAAYIAEVSGE